MHAFAVFVPLDVRAERQGDRHLVALTGELDMDGAGQVSEALRCAEASDVGEIVLDLSGLDFIDSSGIHVIVAACARSQADGDRLRLTHGPAAVQRVFELTDLLDRLPFAD